MDISASMVKDLRDKTGAGMMDCKKALQECEGDLEKGVDWLRQKGLSKAAKRADRATSEGVIASFLQNNDKDAVLVEVKCETDFVARGDKFQEFAKNVAVKAASLAAGEFADDALVDTLGVRDQLNEVISSTGENVTLGRCVHMQLAGEGAIGCYIHNNNKIAVLAEVKCESAAVARGEKFQEFAKNVAMQIAAAAPLAVAPEDLDAALLEREREVYRQKAKEEGKPDNIVDKIADGAVKKYCKEVCLLEQAFIRDDKMSVQDLLKALSSATGEKIVVSRFVRLQLGAE